MVPIPFRVRFSLTRPDLDEDLARFLTPAVPVTVDALAPMQGGPIPAGAAADGCVECAPNFGGRVGARGC